MSQDTGTPRQPPPDVAAVAADDMLLHALGRGEPAPAGDPVAALLAAWRADLATEPNLTAATAGGGAGTAMAGAVTAYAATGAALETVDPSAEPAVTVIRYRRPRPRRRARLALAAAAVLVAGSGAIVAAAAGAGPGSPLWPITRVLYTERARTAVVEDTIAQARRAAADGRYDEARRLLDEAGALIAEVRDPVQARRLRDEVEALRRSLPAVVPGVPVSPAPVPVTPTPSATPGRSQPGGGAAAPAPQPTATSGGGILPLPLPTSSSGGLLPSLPVPGLPLPTVTLG